MQGYNAQIAVDSQAQVIVAADVTQSVVDRGQLLPMCERIRETVGWLPPVISADAGYWDTVSIEHPALSDTELLVAPDATHQWAKPKPGNVSPAVQRMREKLSSGAARELYATRRTTVEPVFGQIKQARGLRRFAFRGLQKVQAEWKLICLTHNLLKMFRYSWLPQTS
ncbi:MAG: transposase [Acidobacteriia bacterium]|nr:transposase [Terriglobia bacterium]